MTKADPTPPISLISVQSFTPQEGHSFTNPHVMVVEVAQAGEGDGRQNKEASVSHLDFKVSMNVVCQNLAKTPGENTVICNAVLFKHDTIMCTSIND